MNADHHRGRRGRAMLASALAMAILAVAAWGQGRRNDPAFAKDQEVFHYLLDHRADVRRTVKNLENGVETLTESDKADVAVKIREHVAAMHERLKTRQGIHLRDPLFATIFRHADKITMKIEPTERGLKVTETSSDPYVVKLIQEHAKVVSQFVANGHEEVRKNHAVPSKDAVAAPEVSWIGEMRKVMRDGDLRGYVDLKRFDGQTDLVAVGPLEGLRGEVTIIDGKPSMSRIVDGQQVVRSDLDGKACFLVFARVPHWRTYPAPAGLTGSELESWIKRQALSAGLNVDRPFPFLLRGRVALARYHVVNKTDDEPHTFAQHDKVKVRFEVKDFDASVVGFYSEKHAGVFTHHDSYVHVHLATTDGKQSGHVDELKTGAGMVLALPAVD